MYKILQMLLTILILSGCNDPNNIVLGIDPTKQLTEDSIKKLSEEDRILLAQYLIRNELAKITNTSISLAGKTVGEVIKEAKELKQHEIIQAKLDEEVKAKVQAEREQISNIIQSSANVVVTGKLVQPKNYENNQYDDLLLFQYNIENKSAKGIKQVNGSILVTDMIGDLVGTLYINMSFSTPIKPGKSLNTDLGIGWKINPFLNGDIERIASKDESTIHAKFVPDAIAFDDGEIIKLPEHKF